MWGGVKLYCDCKDHKVYEWLHMPINGHAGECRYYAVGVSFYNEHLRGRFIELNDFEGRNVESLFLKIIRENRGKQGVRDRFWTQAYITGSGGHTLGKNGGFFYSTDYDSATMKFKMGLRQLFRWLLPFWRV